MYRWYYSSTGVDLEADGCRGKHSAGLGSDRRWDGRLSRGYLIPSSTERVLR